MSEQTVAGKRRLACDRCNSLKLRCPKTQENQSCTRCLKAGAACVFSLSRRGLRPTRAQEFRAVTRCRLDGVPGSYATSETGVSLAPGLDSGLFDPRQDVDFASLNDIDGVRLHDPAFGLTISSFQNASGYNGGPRINSNENTGLPGVSPQPMSPDVDFRSLLNETSPDFWDFGPLVLNSDFAGNETTAVAQTNREAMSLPVSTQVAQQLAELFIDLGKHTATIPPLTIYNCQEAYAASLAADAHDGSPGGRLFSIKSTFQLTQTLINLYPLLGKTNMRTSLPTGLPNFDAPSQEPVGNNSRSAHGPTTPASNSTEILDHASTLQIFSCHHRLIDGWDLIFSHVHKGIQTGKFRHSMGETSPCQKLRIENFVPSTKVPMEVVLSVEFLRQLLSQARELVENISSMRHMEETTVGHGVMDGNLPSTVDANKEATKSAGMAVIARASDLVQKTCHIRDLIEKENGVEA